MKKYLISILLICLLCLTQLALAAGARVEAVYPYNLNKSASTQVAQGSTMPLYLNITSFDNAATAPCILKVSVPQGFTVLPNAGWEVTFTEQGTLAQTTWHLPANFGHSFDLLYLRADEQAHLGAQELVVEFLGQGWQERKLVQFEVSKATGAVVEKENKPSKKKLDKSKFNWYIQGVQLPVDNQGNKDDRAERGVIYVRDTTLEGFRNRMTGDGATNWSAVFNHPATHLLLEMRNPQRDVRLLKFKAELIDKKTGASVPGLLTAGKVGADTEHGWAGETGKAGETTALISLEWKKEQSFILPLYVDYFTVLAGDYSLRVTVSGNGQEKVEEVPLIITKKNNIELMAIAVSFFCLALLLLFSYRLKASICQVGAKGAITIALFAALAFGGITLPTTVLGDLVHVFLGPFSGLITGVLSGVLQYLLVVSLLMLFRKPGVLTLMYFVKYMLSGLMFGHFTPLGMLSMSVNIVLLEIALYFSGFYYKEKLTAKYMLLLAVLLGATDALITFINFEQMMFFYRLYYADWYLALYMLVNSLTYSSIGAWLGYKMGLKLQQVMGE